MDQNTTLMLYKSLALPYFDYGNIVYSVTSKANQSRLQRVQNSACKAILQVNREFHNHDAHVQLDLLPLHYCAELFLLTECHKSMYVTDTYCLEEFFVPILPVTGCRTRFAVNHNVKVPHKRTKVGKNAFCYRGPHSWNRLDTWAKSIEDFNEFKRVILAEMSNRFRTCNNVFTT